MGLLDGYKQILQDYKTKVVDEVREKVLGVGKEEQSSNDDVSSNIDGYIYAENGKFIKRQGNSDSVYIFTKEFTYKQLTDISHNLFLSIAGTAYGESAYSSEAAKCIAHSILNHFRQLASSGLAIYRTEYMGGDFNLQKTLFKIRNNWNDQAYATHNPGFREFLGIAQRENVDFQRDIEKRKNNEKMRKAIEGTIHAFLYELANDISKSGIGWHGLDILSNSEWRSMLYILPEHKKYGFQNYATDLMPDSPNTLFISTKVFQGEKGLDDFATLIYKSSPQALEQSPTGRL